MCEIFSCCDENKQNDSQGGNNLFKKKREVHYLSTDMTYILFEYVIRIVVILVKLSGVEFFEDIKYKFLSLLLLLHQCDNNNLLEN